MPTYTSELVRDWGRTATAESGASDIAHGGGDKLLRPDFIGDYAASERTLKILFVEQPTI